MNMLFFSCFLACSLSQKAEERENDGDCQDGQDNDSDGRSCSDSFSSTDTQDTDIDDTDNLSDTGDDTDTNNPDDVETGNDDDSGNTGTDDPSQVMDFSAVDVNPHSSSVGNTISPRDYMQQISGWYFIKAT